MSININFDTGYLSREEGAGLTALLSAVQPSLLTATEMRAERERGLPSAYTAIGGPNVVSNYAPEGGLGLLAAQPETKPTSADGAAPPAEEPKARRGRKPKIAA